MADGALRRLRRMEPRDWPALERIAAAQNRRDGTSYPLPPVFEMDERRPDFGQPLASIALALVTERWNGNCWRVRQGHVWIRTVEMMDFGGGGEDTEFSIRHLPLVSEGLRAQGYVDMHVLVPKERLGELAGMLAGQGLKRIDGRLAHFFRMLGSEERA